MSGPRRQSFAEWALSAAGTSDGDKSVSSEKSSSRADAGFAGISNLAHEDNAGDTVSSAGVSGLGRVALADSKAAGSEYGSIDLKSNIDSEKEAPRSRQLDLLDSVRRAHIALRTVDALHRPRNNNFQSSSRIDLVRSNVQSRDTDYGAENIDREGLRRQGRARSLSSASRGSSASDTAGERNMMPDRRRRRQRNKESKPLISEDQPTHYSSLVEREIQGQTKKAQVRKSLVHQQRLVQEGLRQYESPSEFEWEHAMQSSEPKDTSTLRPSSPMSDSAPTGEWRSAYVSQAEAQVLFGGASPGAPSLPSTHLSSPSNGTEGDSRTLDDALLSLSDLNTSYGRARDNNERLGAKMVRMSAGLSRYRRRSSSPPPPPPPPPSQVSYQQRRDARPMSPVSKDLVKTWAAWKRFAWTQRKNRRRYSDNDAKSNVGPKNGTAQQKYRRHRPRQPQPSHRLEHGQQGVRRSLLGASAGSSIDSPISSKSTRSNKSGRSSRSIRNADRLDKIGDSLHDAHAAAVRLKAISRTMRRKAAARALQALRSHAELAHLADFKNDYQDKGDGHSLTLSDSDSSENLDFANILSPLSKTSSSYSASWNDPDRTVELKIETLSRLGASVIFVLLRPAVLRSKRRAFSLWARGTIRSRSREAALREILGSRKSRMLSGAFFRLALQRPYKQLAETRDALNRTREVLADVRGHLNASGELRRDEDRRWRLKLILQRRAQQEALAQRVTLARSFGTLLEQQRLARFAEVRAREMFESEERHRAVTDRIEFAAVALAGAQMERANKAALLTRLVSAAAVRLRGQMLSRGFQRWQRQSLKASLLDRAAKVNTLLVSKDLLRASSLHNTMTAWRQFATERKWRRRYGQSMLLGAMRRFESQGRRKNLARALARLEAFGHHSVEAEDRQNSAKRAARRCLGRWALRQQSRGFNAWQRFLLRDKLAGDRSGERAAVLLVTCLLRWRSRVLASALRVWLENTVGAAKAGSVRRKVLSVAVYRLAQSGRSLQERALRRAFRKLERCANESIVLGERRKLAIARMKRALALWRLSALAKSLRLWRKTCLEAPRAEALAGRLMAAFLSRWQNRGLSRALAKWRNACLSSMDSLRAAESIERVVRRWRQRRLAAAVLKWRDSMAVRARAVSLMQRTAARWYKLRLTVGWRRWASFTVVERLQEWQLRKSIDSTKKILGRWRRSAIARAFRHWRIAVVQARTVQTLIGRAVRRWVLRLYRDAFNRWGKLVDRKRQLRLRVRPILLRLGRLYLFGAFLRWKSAISLAVGAERKLTLFLRYWSTVKVRSAFHNWRTIVESYGERERALYKLIVRWRRLSLSKCYRAWHRSTKSFGGRRKAMQKLIARWRRLALSQSWVVLHTQTLIEARKERALGRVFSRWRQLFQRRVFAMLVRNAQGLGSRNEALRRALLRWVRRTHKRKCLHVLNVLKSNVAASSRRQARHEIAAKQLTYTLVQWSKGRIRSSFGVWAYVTRKRSRAIRLLARVVKQWARRVALSGMLGLRDLVRLARDKEAGARRMGRVVCRWEHGRIFRAFSRLGEHLNLSKRQEQASRILGNVIKRWSRTHIRSAFLELKKHARQHLAKEEAATKLSRVLARWRQSVLSQTFESLAAHARARRLLSHSFERLLLSLNVVITSHRPQRLSRRAFATWVKFAKEEGALLVAADQKMRTLDRVCRGWAKRRLTLGFRCWDQVAKKRSRARAVLSSVVRKWARGLAISGLLSLEAFNLRQRQTEKATRQIARVTLRWQQQASSRAFGTLQSHAAFCRTTDTAMKAFARSLVKTVEWQRPRRLLRLSFSRWGDATAVLTRVTCEKRRAARQIAQRWRRFALAKAFGPWRAHFKRSQEFVLKLQVLEKAFRKCAQQEQFRALRCWSEGARHAMRARQVLSLVVQRWIRGVTLSGFRSWKAFAKIARDKERAVRLVAKVSNRWRRGQAGFVLDTLRTNVLFEKRLKSSRQSLGAMVHRWARGLKQNAFFKLRSCAKSFRNKQAGAHRLARIVARWQESTVGRSFHILQSFAHASVLKSLQSKRLLISATRRWTRKNLVVAVRLWKATVDGAKSKRTAIIILGHLVGRWKRGILRRAFDRVLAHARSCRKKGTVLDGLTRALSRVLQQRRPKRQLRRSFSLWAQAAAAAAGNSHLLHGIAWRLRYVGSTVRLRKLRGAFDQWEKCAAVYMRRDIVLMRLHLVHQRLGAKHALDRLKLRALSLRATARMVSTLQRFDRRARLQDGFRKLLTWYWKENVQSLGDRLIEVLCKNTLGGVKRVLEQQVSDMLRIEPKFVIVRPGLHADVLPGSNVADGTSTVFISTTSLHVDQSSAKPSVAKSRNEQRKLSSSAPPSAAKGPVNQKLGKRRFTAIHVQNRSGQCITLVLIAQAQYAGMDGSREMVGLRAYLNYIGPVLGSQWMSLVSRSSQILRRIVHAMALRAQRLAFRRWAKVNRDLKMFSAAVRRAQHRSSTSICNHAFQLLRSNAQHKSQASTFSGRIVELLQCERLGEVKTMVESHAADILQTQTGSVCMRPSSWADNAAVGNDSDDNLALELVDVAGRRYAQLHLAIDDMETLDGLSRRLVALKSYAANVGPVLAFHWLSCMTFSSQLLQKALSVMRFQWQRLAFRRWVVLWRTTSKLGAALVKARARSVLDSKRTGIQCWAKWTRLAAAKEEESRTGKLFQILNAKSLVLAKIILEEQSASILHLPVHMVHVCRGPASSERERSKKDKGYFRLADRNDQLLAEIEVSRHNLIDQALILRFERFLNFVGPPLSYHWPALISQARLCLRRVVHSKFLGAQRLALRRWALANRMAKILGRLFARAAKRADDGGVRWAFSLWAGQVRSAELEKLRAAASQMAGRMGDMAILQKYWILWFRTKTTRAGLRKGLLRWARTQCEYMLSSAFKCWSSKTRVHRFRSKALSRWLRAHNNRLTRGALRTLSVWARIAKERERVLLRWSMKKQDRMASAALSRWAFVAKTETLLRRVLGMWGRKVRQNVLRSAVHHWRVRTFANRLRDTRLYAILQRYSDSGVARALQQRAWLRRALFRWQGVARGLTAQASCTLSWRKRSSASALIAHIIERRKAVHKSFHTWTSCTVAARHAWLRELVARWRQVAMKRGTLARVSAAGGNLVALQRQRRRALLAFLTWKHFTRKQRATGRQLDEARALFQDRYVRRLYPAAFHAWKQLVWRQCQLRHQARQLRTRRYFIGWRSLALVNAVRRKSLRRVLSPVLSTMPVGTVDSAFLRWSVETVRAKVVALKDMSVSLGESTAAALREKESHLAHALQEASERKALVEKIKSRANNKIRDLITEVEDLRASADNSERRIEELEHSLADQRKAHQLAELQLAKSRDENSVMRQSMTLRLSDLEELKQSRLVEGDEHDKLLEYCAELEKKCFDSEFLLETRERKLERKSRKVEELELALQDSRFEQERIELVATLERESLKDALTSTLRLDQDSP